MQVRNDWLKNGIALYICLSVGCSTSKKSNINNTSDDGGSDAGSLSKPDFAIAGTDFPVTPIIDPAGTAPANSATLFANAPAGAATAPCISEPQAGTLLPKNWLRPRFTFTPSAGQNLFEIRVHASAEHNDLVVYTTQTTWTMDNATWTAISAALTDTDITVQVRGGVFASGALTTLSAVGTSDFTIAPAAAPGAIVYWTTTDMTALRGFTIGDEGVHTVLTPAQVGSTTQCIGCHSSTPDGSDVAFSTDTQANGSQPFALGIRTLDGAATVPSFVSSAAATQLNITHQQLPFFSKAHWATGDRVMLTSAVVNNKTEIVWIDLEASSNVQGTGWGVLARTGDANQAATATVSHDGLHLVYASDPAPTQDVNTYHADLRTVPYGARQGGASTAIAGASDPAYNEYYPSYSPDDQLIAFDRVPDGTFSYDQALAEVFVIPAAGGTATRLAANDPPACGTGAATSPGVTNSWPKWAPGITAASGSRTFYWLAFSSHAAGVAPQLYVTPVVVTNGVAKSYPRIYLWNQPATDANHTPAWDDFTIPIQ